MRTRILILATVAVGVFAVTLPSSAGTIAKTSCTSIGAKKVSVGRLYTCVKTGTKKQWNAGANCPSTVSILTLSNVTYACKQSGSQKLWKVAVVPAAPTGLAVTNGDGRATVRFTAGASGDGPVTNYQYTLNNGASWVSFLPTKKVSPVVISGLNNDVAYTIKLRAISKYGVGKVSAGVAARPVAPVLPPVNVTTATIRLVSPDVNDALTVNDAGDMTYFVSQDWFAAGSQYFFRAAVASAPISLTYEARNQNGALITNHEIFLRVNRANSGSNAKFSTSVGDVNGMQSGAGTDSARIPGMTDVHGRVTFTFSNTDLIANAPDFPAGVSLNALRGSGKIIGQVAPMLVPDGKTTTNFGELDQISDVLNLSFFKEPVAPVEEDPNVDLKPTIDGHVIGNQLWKDAFTGNAGAAPSTSNWIRRYCGQTAANGGGSCYGGERQHYIPDASKLDGTALGNLVITTTHLASESNSNCGVDWKFCDFNSGRLDTQGKVSFQYGYIEARIATPVGGGNWPAFWMLGDNINEVSWPNCGEMDVMEGKGAFPTLTTGAFHYSTDITNWQAHSYNAGSFDDGRAITGRYHRYGIAWLPDSVTLYVDGVAFLTRTPSTLNPNAYTDSPGTAQWPYTQPFFLILNNAIDSPLDGNGGFGGPYDDWSTSQMKVDWVRSYQLDGQGSVVQH